MLQYVGGSGVAAAAAAAAGDGDTARIGSPMYILSPLGSLGSLGP